MRARTLLLALLGTSPAFAGDGLTYTREMAASVVVVDTRPVAECVQATLPNARCLPVTEFLSPDGRLPSERDLLWLLGTAALDGGEAVLVVGDSPTARDFVGGLLHLCGQRQVQILIEPISPLLAGRKDVVPGQRRGIVRAKVFTAPMRDDLWVVNARELADAPANSVVHAHDPYTAIVRYARQAATGDKSLRVAWSQPQERQSR
jgi:thiosulfate/3-mercaptopyruvate sulfurtransferase